MGLMSKAIPRFLKEYWPLMFSIGGTGIGLAEFQRRRAKAKRGDRERWEQKQRVIQDMLDRRKMK